ncbi:MAG: lysophospholipid acyltransferase family protein [Bacteroidetes bacterium]|nr:lysophospholipid acyltransferase family protein [Bacteroidota bacterium]
MPFLYLLSILPFRVLYFISDIFYFFLYHVIGYRRKVVMANLKNSFPEKSDKELRALCGSFYRYFCDLFLETFKTLTISRRSMLRHCSMDPGAAKLFEGFAAQNQNVIIVMGHKGNWEWAGNTFSLCCRHQLYVIYHPLSNPWFNKLIVKMRTRFGTKLIVMQDTFRDMVRHREHLNATAFIADQAPSPEKAWWMSFLNQDTPVFMGTEKIALKMKYPIVYVSVKKIKRGYYTLTADLLKIPPYTTSEGEITTAHTQRLENDIIGQPETWLWTHRRWKHKRTGTVSSL